MNGNSSGLVHGAPGTQQTIEQTELATIVAENENNAGYSMPNHSKAITPIEKFVNYSLDYSNPNAKGKAEAYKKGLGFTKSNAGELKNQIENSVKSGVIKPYEVTKSEYGIKYKYRIPVKGPNGKTKNVIAVYQIDKGTNTPRLITNYLEGK